MKEWMETLSACPLFEGIKGEALTEVLTALHAVTRSYARGSTVLNEGDPTRWLGIVLAGRVQIVRVDYYGNRSILAEITQGRLFAESFACAGVRAMPVSVVAASETTVLLLDAERLLTADAVQSRLTMNLLRILAGKNLLMNRKLEITSKRTTREKLMTYLLGIAKERGSAEVRIPFDRQELADYLEVDRSGLSAEIGKLRREKVLLCRKNEFTIL